MTEEKETFYYRHNIMNEIGYHRPVTMPISMTETLTLRDQFAMAALTGLISRAPDFMFPDLSQKAYRFADAMLEERKEKTDGLP
jgi:hypothetical protein